MTTTTTPDPLPAYIDSLTARRYSPRTILGARLTLRRLESACGPLVTITAGMLVGHVAELVRAGLASASVAKAIITWRGFYRWVAEQDDPAIPLADANPCRRLVAPKGPARLRRVLTEAEAGWLLAALRERLVGSPMVARDAAAAALLALTGCRCGELVGLDWVDVDRAAGTVTVIGKGDKQRAIAAPCELFDLLDVYAPDPELRRGPVLADVVTGQAINQDQARRGLRRVLVAAGLDPAITPHCLRHTYATLLVLAEVPIEQIQIQLGHASIATTQRYARARVTERTKARLGAILWSPAENHGEKGRSER